jgi:Zn-dependent protease with chaperone function
VLGLPVVGAFFFSIIPSIILAALLILLLRRGRKDTLSGSQPKSKVSHEQPRDFPPEGITAFLNQIVQRPVDMLVIEGKIIHAESRVNPKVICGKGRHAIIVTEAAVKAGPEVVSALVHHEAGHLRYPRTGSFRTVTTYLLNGAYPLERNFLPILYAVLVTYLASLLPILLSTGLEVSEIPVVTPALCWFILMIVLSYSAISFIPSPANRQLEFAADASALHTFGGDRVAAALTMISEQLRGLEKQNPVGFRTWLGELGPVDRADIEAAMILHREDLTRGKRISVIFGFHPPMVARLERLSNWGP